jgi:hypothetical protein
MKSLSLKIDKIEISFLFVIITILIFPFQSFGQNTNLGTAPKVITPGTGTAPPSDAIVLFDGTNFDAWVSTKGGDVKWDLKKGVMTVVPGTYDIKTKQSFGDCQLLIEWRNPAKVVGESQNRGNSGIFLQRKYEVQVLDSYKSETYIDGQAGSIYKQHVPLVNACLPPGKWQTYDIIFIALVFNDNGTLITPAYLTVLQNGILIQNHVELKGKTSGEAIYEMHGKLSLSLQDRRCLVSYRNIWIREL